MKKIIPLAIIGMLGITGLIAAAAVPVEKSSLAQPEFRITVRSGFGLHVIIENIGDAYAYETSCWIVFLLNNNSRLGPFPSSDSFFVGVLAPGQTNRVHFKTVGFGFGIFSKQPNLEISVGCVEQAHAEITTHAIVLGSFIIIT